MPDPKLVNQDGDKVHLSDLMKGRVAALSFIFTSCPTVCATSALTWANRKPAWSVTGQGNLAHLHHHRPGERHAGEAEGVGKQFHAAPGWRSSPAKTEINELLKKLQVFTPDIQAHSPLILIVNDRTGEWTRVNVLDTPPQMIAEKLRQLVAP
jgi:cytochrome oxidase Cu insertion factor (SCO1/SenC/PrrC family)